MGAVDGVGNITRRSVPAYVYVTSHGHSRAVCVPFAEGCGGQLVSVERGEVFQDAPAVTYGRLRGCDSVVKKAERAGLDWYFIDRGYIGATRDYDYTGYFRVTRNAFQCDGTGPASPERARRLGVELRPWRSTGAHVLVCPPSETFSSLGGFSRAKWIDSVVATLSKHTDREIRVRSKPAHGIPSVPLSVDFENCWAVVLCNSNVGVDALISGIPVFTTHPCAASGCASGGLESIETPFRGDGREKWIEKLAAQQWTLQEMRSGKCWSDLLQRARYEL